MESDRDARYVCSDCGYSRESVNAVVEHINRAHDDSARVMEYETAAEDGVLTAVGRLVRWVKGLFP